MDSKESLAFVNQFSCRIDDQLSTFSPFFRHVRCGLETFAIWISYCHRWKLIVAGENDSVDPDVAITLCNFSTFLLFSFSVLH